MMITHHLFGFPDWIIINNPFYELTIFHIPIWLSIGKFCKICVSIFAFISGMGIYLSFRSKETNKKRIYYVFQKIIKLLIIYELSYVCFILPILLLFRKYSINEVIDNFLILKSSIVYTNWYITFYVEAILIALLHYILPIKENFVRDIILCFLFPIILNIFFPNNIFGHYFPVFMLGYLFSKHNIFSAFEKKITIVSIRLIIIFLLLFLSLLIKIYFGEFFLKISTITFITPFLCYLLSCFIELISRLKIVKDILAFLAKYSTWYWFIHVIFHSNIILLQKIVYFPKIPIFIIIFTFLVLTPFAILLQKIYYLILRLQNFVIKLLW